MKTYINAELEIVRMENDIIATSLGVNNAPTDNMEGEVAGRRSIWN